MVFTKEDKIADFIPPTLWPPNSPDLNPVDYKIWSVMQEKVYHSRIEDVDELCKAAWEELDQRIIEYRYCSQAVAHSPSCMCQGKRRPL